MWQKKVIQDVRWRAGCVVAPQLHDVLDKNSIEHHQKLPEINLGQEKVLNYNMGTLTKCPLVNPPETSLCACKTLLPNAHVPEPCFPAKLIP